MKLFVNVEIGGLRKVYTFENDDPSLWNKRTIVADFVDSPAGDIAYAAFVQGIARKTTAEAFTTSLWDYATGKCLAGNLDQLMGV